MGEIKKVAVAPGTPLVDGEVVGIKSSDEKWSTYILEDGTQIKAKISVGEVIRVIDRYDQEGVPLYVTRGAPIQIVSAPEGLRKKS
jgi:hypothetical protein